MTFESVHHTHIITSRCSNCKAKSALAKSQPSKQNKYILWQSLMQLIIRTFIHFPSAFISVYHQLLTKGKNPEWNTIPCFEQIAFINIKFTSHVCSSFPLFDRYLNLKHYKKSRNRKDTMKIVRKKILK